jgi:hypothetical protein
MALTLNEKRNFNQRKKGLYSKLTKFVELFGAQVYLHVKCESLDYGFITGGDAHFPPNFNDVVIIDVVVTSS